MKKSIGGVVGLYPTPVVIVGMKVDEHINWINIAHIGIIGHDKLMISSNKNHYSNDLIKKANVVSVNLVTQEMLVKADYVGMVSGKTINKSSVFDYQLGQELDVPLIIDSPVSMECKVVDIYDSGSHENFILEAVNTLVDASCLNDSGRIDYQKVQPVLFEMPNRQYLSIGDVVGQCWSEGKEFMSQ